MESADLDLKKIVRLLFIKRYLIALTGMAISTVVILIAYALPDVYEANSSVLIESNVISNLVQGIAVTPSLDDRLRNISVAMKSRELILRVINRLNLDVNQRTQDDIEELVKSFQKDTVIKVTNAKTGTKVDVFNVSYRDRDPKLARDFVNTLISEYIEMNMSAKRDEAYGANRFLAEQIKDFKVKIDAADKEIIDYRKEKGIFTGIDEQNVVNDIKVQQDKIDELEIQRMELEAKKNLISQQLKNEKPYAVMMMSKKTGESAADKLVVLQKKLSDLLMHYTENYPEVVRIQSEIEQIKAQIANEKSGEDVQYSSGTDETSALNPMYQQLREELSKIEFEIAGVDAKKSRFERIIEGKKSELKHIPDEKKKLADLERERDSLKNIYTQLINRLSQSEVSKRMELQDKSETFKIVDLAVLPNRPVSPNRLRIIIMGFLAGLGGGFGIVLLFEYMNGTIKSVESLKEMGLPILAIIPIIETRNEIMMKRKKDIMLSTVVGIYLLCIAGLVAKEMLGFMP